MTIQIAFPNEQQNEVRDRHDSIVLDALRRTIETKNDTLQWKDSVEACAERFRVYKADVQQHFVELAFTAHNTNYRAILGWLAEYEVFVVLSVFRKEDHYQSSQQHDVFNQLDRNPREVIREARRQYEDVIKQPA